MLDHLVLSSVNFFNRSCYNEEKNKSFFITASLVNRIASSVNTCYC